MAYANQGKFAWHPPFIAHGTDKYADADIARVARHFAAHIASFSSAC